MDLEDSIDGLSFHHHHRPKPEDEDRKLLDYIILSLFVLHRKVDRIMTDISGLSTDVDTLTTSVAGAKSALDDLAAQVAALTAGSVSQEDIDALDAKIKEASGALDASVSTDDPAPVVAPPADNPPAES